MSAEFPRPLPKGLTDEELRSILETEIRQSINHETGEIAIAQEKAIEYYEGRPFGNEVEGSSQVVLRDMAETVDWAMPAIMRAFFYTSETVRYEDATPDSEAQGHGGRMTRVVNEFFRQKLGGFRFVFDWAKAGLMERLAAAKFCVESVREPLIEHHRAVGEDSLVQLLESWRDEDVEILDQSESVQVVPSDVGPVEVPVFELRVKIWREFKRPRLETLPPEEFLCSRRAKRLDEQIPFAAHRKVMRKSDLHSLGVPWETVEGLQGSRSRMDYDGRTVTRHEDEDTRWTAGSRSDPASQEVTVTESFLLVDYDGDGFSERRRVLSAGDDTQTILGHDYAPLVPIVGWTPIPMPHKLYGRSYYDVTRDLQEIRSTLARQLLDNIYRMNHARHKVRVESVDLDSYLDTAPGAPVLVDEMDAIEPLQVPALPPWAFEALSYFEKVREQRTGIHPYSQEVYAAGQNQTAQGVSQVFEAAMAQVQLLTQMLGAGLEDLFRLIPRVMKHAGMGPDRIRVGDEWIEYNPQEWPDEMRVSVQVGLSPGQTEQRIQRLLLLLGLQKEAMSQTGDGFMVSWDQIFQTGVRIVEQSGFASAGAFFSSPAGKQPPEPPPDPKAIEMEAKGRDMQSARTLELAKLEWEKERERAQQARLEREAEREHERELLRIQMQEETARYTADQQLKAAQAKGGRGDREGSSD